MNPIRLLPSVVAAVFSCAALAACSSEASDDGPAPAPDAATEAGQGPDALCPPGRRGANEATVRALYEKVFNGHDIAASDRYIVPEYIQHDPQVPPGREGFKQFFSAFFQAAPDTTAEIVDLATSCDTVMIRVRMRGTYDGPFGSITVVNRPFDFFTADVFRLENDQIVEHWDVVDNLTLLTQLGAL